jgi:glycosyltransferase involved in cell wall biosynthesis
MTGELHSICMLCSNDGATVRESLDSVLALSAFRPTEVVVTDNKSTDGSAEVLREYRDKGLIKLVEKKCVRGEGRQYAFEASSGKYILAHMDCDDIFSARGVDALIAAYHASYEGIMVMTRGQDPKGPASITIAPREVVAELGGWRDLNWGEDWDIWGRAYAAKKYAFIPYPSDNAPHVRITVRERRYAGIGRGFGVRVEKYSDAIRIRRKVFDPGEHISIVQRLAYYTARASVALRRDYLQPSPPQDFWEYVT